MQGQLTDIEPDGDGWGTGELYDRYFYYPDHLVRLPKIPGASDPIGMIQGLAGLAVDLYREPLYKGALSFLWNLWRGKTTDGKRPGLEDVSIGEEVLRRGGRREPVDNMLSAMCHGIYGGDVWKLSAESSIIGPYFMNQRLVIRYRSHWQKWTDRRVRIPNQDADLLSYIPWKGHMGRLLRESMRIRALNLGAGFGTLTDGIVEKLKANANVKFVDEKVTKLRLSATGRMEVCARVLINFPSAVTWILTPRRRQQPPNGLCNTTRSSRPYIPRPSRPSPRTTPSPPSPRAQR